MRIPHTPRVNPNQYQAGPTRSPDFHVLHQRDHDPSQPPLPIWAIAVFASLGGVFVLGLIGLGCKRLWQIRQQHPISGSEERQAAMRLLRGYNVLTGEVTKDYAIAGGWVYETRRGPKWTRATIWGMGTNEACMSWDDDHRGVEVWKLQNTDLTVPVPEEAGFAPPEGNKQRDAIYAKWKEDEAKRLREKLMKNEAAPSSSGATA